MSNVWKRRCPYRNVSLQNQKTALELEDICNATKQLRRTKPKTGRDRPEKAGEIEINHQRSQITGDTVFLSKIYELSILQRRQINLEFRFSPRGSKLICFGFAYDLAGEKPTNSHQNNKNHPLHPYTRRVLTFTCKISQSLSATLSGSNPSQMAPSLNKTTLRALGPPKTSLPKQNQLRTLSFHFFLGHRFFLPVNIDNGT